MKKNLLFLLCCLAITCLTYACNTATVDSAADAGKNGEPGVGEYFAIVNGVKLPRSRLSDRLASISRGGKEITKEIRAAAVDELVRFELLLQETRKTGLYDSAEIVDKVRGFKDNLVITTFIKNQIQNNISINDEDVSTFYKEDTDNLFERENVQASHILVKSKEVADKVYTELSAGADFALLAKKYSIDTGTKQRGGDLGSFGRGVMVKPFDNALFKLAEGGLSKPVKTQFGYHIIKLVKKFPKEKIPFKDVESKIRRVLLNKRQQDALREYTDRLIHGNKVMVIDAAS